MLRLRHRIKEVFAQVNAERTKQGIEPLIEPVGDSTSLMARSDGNTLRPRWWTNNICQAGLSGWADYKSIESGVHYLQKLQGSCGNGPGPGNCGRISCSYNSAI